MINKTIVLSFLGGLVIGAVGYKFYNENKDTIKSKLKEAGIVPSCGDSGCCGGRNCSADLNLEELMAQKERLEDLIAELQANQPKA